MLGDKTLNNAESEDTDAKLLCLYLTMLYWKMRS